MYGMKLRRTMNLKNKYAIGCHVMFYEIEMLDEYLNSIKRALFQGRTVVWFKDSLIGLKQNLIPLLESCLSISSGKYLDDTNILSIEINNNSGASFILKNSSSYSFQNYDDLISIDPKASIKLEIKTIEKLERLRLPFIVLNALETPKKNAEIILEYEVGK